MRKSSSREYYFKPGQITGFTGHKEFLDWLLPDPVILYQVAQGLIIHDGWLKRYNAKVRCEQWFKECLPTAQRARPIRADSTSTVFTMKDGLKPKAFITPNSLILSSTDEKTVFTT